MRNNVCHLPNSSFGCCHPALRSPLQTRHDGMRFRVPLRAATELREPPEPDPS
jgi:hypothetical protein